jgi:hypothetical protein
MHLVTTVNDVPFMQLHCNYFSVSLLMIAMIIIIIIITIMTIIIITIITINTMITIINTSNNAYFSLLKYPTGWKPLSSLVHST